MARVLIEEDKQRIRQAIELAERHTSGELVAVVTRVSDPYLFIPLLWASLAALLIPMEMWLYDPEVDVLHVYQWQLGIFAGLGVLFHWLPLKLLLVPGFVKRHRAGRLAFEQFFKQKLHTTRDRTGVLIFVSVAEHYVEIIADKGINDRVDPGTWDAVIEKFVKEVHAGRVVDGYVAAVHTCGNILAKHFPRPADDSNELSNDPVELTNRLIEI